MAQMQKFTLITLYVILTASGLFLAMIMVWFHYKTARPYTVTTIMYVFTVIAAFQIGGIISSQKASAEHAYITVGGAQG